MDSQKYKLTADVNSDLEEFRILEYLKDHFDTAFLTVDNIKLEKDDQEPLVLSV